jgi:hypothetical protein
MARPAKEAMTLTDLHCGIGFGGGRCPSLAHYVTGMGPMDGATAAGGRSCCLSSRRCPQSLMIVDSLTGPVSCGRRRRPSTSTAGSAGRHYRRTGLSSESQLYADATRASISSSTGMPFSPFVMAAMP